VGLTAPQQETAPGEVVASATLASS
jgi:hypothetical protein